MIFFNLVFILRDAGAEAESFGQRRLCRHYITIPLPKNCVPKLKIHGQKNLIGSFSFVLKSSGKGTANCDSLIQALQLAVRLAKSGYYDNGFPAN